MFDTFGNKVSNKTIQTNGFSYWNKLIGDSHWEKAELKKTVNVVEFKPYNIFSYEKSRIDCSLTSKGDGLRSLPLERIC